MRQTLHLLVLDHDASSALARWHGSQWILPILDLDERVRAPQPVLRWLSDHGVQGEVVGQWSGRMQAAGAGVDWMFVVRGHGMPTAALPHGLGETSMSALKRSPAVLPYQRWALSAIAPTGNVPGVGAPFGSIDWPVEARRWVNDVLGTRALSIVPLRVSAFELVLQLETADATYFLKGLSANRACEALVTMRLHDLMPGSFARTVAHRTRPDGSVWWLMASCPGRSLAHALTRSAVWEVAVACGRVQREVAADAPVRALLPPIDAPAVEAWLTELLSTDGRWLLVERCISAWHSAWRSIEPAAVPTTWVACDLDPSNVFVNGREVRFIDLDDCMRGPAPLAIAILARRIRQEPEVATHLCRAYEASWPATLAIGRHWQGFDRIARLLQCYLGWRRVQLQSERGEIVDALDGLRQMLATRVIRLCLEASRSD